jgi:5-methylcytosine-specific restriction endonuclease McrA
MSFAMKHVHHERALAAARSYQKAEAELVLALQAVEKSREFVDLGYSSMFAYAVRELGLSESVAYSAISVARKARVVPELHARMAAGAISLSKAKKIASVITQDNQEVWLAKASLLTSHEIEREVARENPKLAVREQARYVSGSRLELKLGIEEELLQDLRRAQDLVSQSAAKAASYEDTLRATLAFFLRHKDPVLKAARNLSKPLKTQFSGTVPAANRHRVVARDQGRCQFARADGSKCGAERWTDVHHVEHQRAGGTHAPENLEILCRAHHRHAHQS